MSQPLNPTFLTVPCPTDRRADLLPAEVAELLDTLELRRQQENDAEVRVGQARTAQNAAPKRDADALAAAIRSGDPDPGPVNVTTANAEFDEATRLAAGHRAAAEAASVEAHRAILGTDRDAVVQELNRRALHADATARAAIEAAEAATFEVRTLRALAVYLADFPQRGDGSLNYDHDNHRIAKQGQLKVLDGMRPDAPLSRW